MEGFRSHQNSIPEQINEQIKMEKTLTMPILPREPARKVTAPFPFSMNILLCVLKIEEQNGINRENGMQTASKIEFRICFGLPRRFDETERQLKVYA
jgi:hypothetical protein